MESTVGYLDKVLSDLGYTVQRQEFRFYEVTSVNLEVEIPGHLYPEEIVVVGAHYDTVHTPADTPEKLDYARMARVVTGLARTIEELAEKE